MYHFSIKRQVGFVICDEDDDTTHAATPADDAVTRNRLRQRVQTFEKCIDI